MAMHIRSVVLIASAVLVCAPFSAPAQNSREDAARQAQAEKAQTLRPYTSTRVEQLVVRAQRALILTPEGFYPLFGSVYSGGGFTAGAGYRKFIADRAHWNVEGLYSAKNYKWIQLGLQTSSSPSGGFEAAVRTGWRDATQVNYYGLGIDSPVEDRSTYRMRQGYVGGDVTVRPKRWLPLRGGAAFEGYKLSEGTGNVPSIEQLFSPGTAPGLGDAPDYVHTFASAGIDTRPSPGYARHGGLYEVAYHRYDDTEETYSFDRLGGELVQHVPILRESWVLSFHGAVQTTLDDDDVVPYFLLPSLGSGSTLRAYPSWRFRDRHSALVMGEWRWLPSRLAFDAAIFYDAGLVAARREDLRLSDMKHDFGFGVRFHTPAATPLRIDVARGSEGFNLVFGGSAAF